jgi:Zn-dependent protease
MPLQFLPQDMIFLLPAVLIALTVHEFAHAYTSFRLGDPTPKWQGRLTLNPVAHIDPMGLIMLVLFRFGWGKAVEVDPSYYRNRRQGVLMVSLAGPAANVITAFVILLLSVFFRTGFARQLLAYTFQLNLVLAVFNLLPIPPLDGSKILASLLPPRLSYQYMAWLGQWGFVILILLVATGATRTLIVGPVTVIASILNFIVSLVVRPFL